MSKHTEPFRFKEFEVEHCRSSMKVGVDAVVLGAWISCSENQESGNSCRILDVGCGCGVISLMLAQKWVNSTIMAIDIDEPSVEECRVNFNNSDWSNRLSAEQIDFFEFCRRCKDLEEYFDCIVSNPPYFESGVTNTDTSRLKARHQGELNPVSFILEGSKLLKKGGVIAMVVPFEQEAKICELCNDNSLSIVRLMHLRDREDKLPKRSFIEVSKTEGVLTQIELEEIIVRGENGEYSQSYRNLCKDYYLKF